MFKIIKNTYPKEGIGKHNIGTLCNWKVSNGHLLLVVCNEDGTFKKKGTSDDIIFTHGQVYSLKGNLLSNKKEPPITGLVAKYVKKGWYLTITNCD